MESLGNSEARDSMDERKGVRRSQTNAFKKKKKRNNSFFVLLLIADFK